MTTFTKHNMDYYEGVFGVRLQQNNGSNGLVELYVEDNGNYYFACSFDRTWTKELINVLARVPHLPIDWRDDNKR